MLETRQFAFVTSGVAQAFLHYVTAHDGRRPRTQENEPFFRPHGVVVAV